MKISVAMLSVCYTLSVRQLTLAFQSSPSSQRLANTACNRRIKSRLFWGEKNTNFSTDSSQNQDRKFRNKVEDSGGGGWDDLDDERRSNEPVKYIKGKSTNRRRQNGNSGYTRSSSNKDNYNFKSSDGRRPSDRGGNNRGQRGAFEGGYRNNDSRGSFESGYRNNDRRGSFEGGYRNNDRRMDSSHDRKEADENKINMKALEEAGFQHLYGLSPVVNALAAARRSFTVDDDDDENHGGEDMLNDDIKPTAQLKPGLFIQDGKRQLQGSGKASTVEEIVRLAEEKKIRISYVDKGELNTLSGNRPHQVSLWFLRNGQSLILCDCFIYYGSSSDFSRLSITTITGVCASLQRPRV